MIVRIITAVLVLLVSYVGFLIANTPASWVIAQARPQLAASDITLVNVRGGAWRGSADLGLQGESLGRLHWDASPWPLIAGNLNADFALTGNSLRLRGTVATDNQRTRLTDLHGQADITTLARLLNLPVGLTGTIVADLDKVVVDSHQTIRSAVGKLVAHGVRIPDLGVGLGNLTLTLANSGESVTGQLHNDGGDIALDGTLTLTSSGAYVLQATLKPRPGPKQNRIRDGLTVILGATDSSGRFHYNATGQLKLQY